MQQAAAVVLLLICSTIAVGAVSVPTNDGWTYVLTACVDSACTHCDAYSNPYDFVTIRNDGCVAFEHGKITARYTCDGSSVYTSQQWDATDTSVMCPSNVEPSTTSFYTGCFKVNDGYHLKECVGPNGPVPTNAPSINEINVSSTDVTDVPSTDDAASGPSVGSQVGIAIGVAAGVAIVVVAIVLIKKFNSAPQQTTPFPHDENPTEEANDTEGKSSTRVRDENVRQDEKPEGCRSEEVVEVVSHVNPQKAETEKVELDGGDTKTETEGAATSDTDVFERERNLTTARVTGDGTTTPPGVDPKEFHESIAPTNNIPLSRCFSRSPKLSFPDALRVILLCNPPEDRPDLKNLIPDADDVDNVARYIERLLPTVKATPAVTDLVVRCALTDDDVRVLITYKVESPFPVYKWLNALLTSSRRGIDSVSSVGPFFTLLYRAQEKLPVAQCRAARAVVVKNIPALKSTFDHYTSRLAPGMELNFWGFSSFSTDDAVINSKAFMGATDEEAIVYSCPEVSGVDMEPFRPPSMAAEAEILPLPPSMFKVIVATMVGKKLTVVISQVSNTDDAYIAPRPSTAKESL